MSELDLVKLETRKRFLARRSALPAAEVDKLSRLVWKRLAHLPEFTRADVVLFYVSFRNEVDTLPMIKGALSLGKRVAVPRTLTKEKLLVPCEISDASSGLRPGAYGILEPVVEKRLELDELGVVIVPGVAFDEGGGRLGYGGGYYDRLMARLPDDVSTIGLAYDFQVVPRLPRGANDVPVELIVTESRIIRGIYYRKRDRKGE